MHNKEHGTVENESVLVVSCQTFTAHPQKTLARYNRRNTMLSVDTDLYKFE